MERGSSLLETPQSSHPQNLRNRKLEAVLASQNSLLHTTLAALCGKGLLLKDKLCLKSKTTHETTTQQKREAAGSTTLKGITPQGDSKGDLCS